MRRMLLSVFLAAALLTGCGGRETPVSPDEAPEAALTEQDVINMYTAASAVYDWFDLTTLPLDMEDARTEGGLTYYRVAAEDLSLPIAAVPEPHGQHAFLDAGAGHHRLPGGPAGGGGDLLLPGDGGQPLCPVPGPLQGTSTASSTPPTAAGGSNVYLLDKTAAAEQVGEDHWTVTVTFYADSWAFEETLR